MNSIKSNLSFKLLFHLLPLLVFFILFFVSIKDEKVMIGFYGNLSFYLIAGLVIIWFFQLYMYLQHYCFDLKRFLKSNWVGLVTALIVTSVIFCSVPVYFKVLNDETNLLSVSQSMFHEKQAFRISMAKVYHNGFHIVENKIPKRPLLFPFVLFLIHTIAGYHYQNAYILNFIIMFIFLSGSFICTKKFTDSPSALSAMFFICAYPVFTIYGASGGFDLFSTLFFYLSMILLYQFIHSPSASGFAFLWVSLIMLSNIRYESVIFFLIIPLGLLLVKKKLFLKKYAYLYSFTPILFLPYIWQRFLTQGRYENPVDKPLFGISSFFHNLYILIENFLNLKFSLPYAGILNFLGVIILLYLFAQFARKKISISRNQLDFWSIYGVCLSIIMVIILSHFLGRYDHPVSARFFLNLSICLALTPVIVRIKFPHFISGKQLLAFSVVLFFLYHPIASTDEFNNSLKISRIHNESKKFLEQLAETNILIISGYSTQFSSLNYGTVTFDYVNQHKDLIKYEYYTNKFEKIFIIREINNRTKQPIYKNQYLDSSFKIKPIKEIEVYKNISLQISSLSF